MTPIFLISDQFVGRSHRGGGGGAGDHWEPESRNGDVSTFLRHLDRTRLDVRPCVAS
jgi:hypothetical protein